MKHTVALLVALLLAPLAAVHAADNGVKPDVLRQLAKLPSININFNMGFQSTDFGLGQTNNVASRSETELRETLKSSPSNTTAWCELGEQLVARAARDHLHMEHFKIEDFPALLAAVQAERLTRNDVQQARQLMNEALGCYAKAIASAPEKIDAYLQRLNCRLSWGTCLQALLDTLDGKKPNLSQVLTPDTLDDLQQAARICPDKVKLQATFFIYLRTSEAATKRDGVHRDKAFAAKSQATMAEIRSRLETLASRNEPQLAVQACEGLAMTELVFGANDDAQKYARRAVTLEPARDSAWELLTAVQIKAERDAELLAVCAERVKAADTSRNRYFLAKAHEQLAQYDQVLEQIELILKREPDNFLAATGKAAMLLRRGDDARAGECLQRAATLVNERTDPAQHADLLVLQAIQALLRGDRNTAELHLGHALQLDEKNRNVRTVLRALGP